MTRCIVIKCVLQVLYILRESVRKPIADWSTDFTKNCGSHHGSGVLRLALLRHLPFHLQSHLLFHRRGTVDEDSKASDGSQLTIAFIIKTRSKCSQLGIPALFSGPSASLLYGLTGLALSSAVVQRCLFDYDIDIGMTFADRCCGVITGSSSTKAQFTGLLEPIPQRDRYLFPSCPRRLQAPT